LFTIANLIKTLMNKKVLMIAFHFPPLKGSSGIQRTLKFCQYLPKFGWQPIVLSANKRAYEAVSLEQMGDISPNLPIYRSFALDTKQHLSINGRYPELLAIPDRWLTWIFDGVIQGLLIIRRMKPLIIWSTYPIATAQLIGYFLHRLTGLPWIADLRDPMAQDGYPENPTQWKAFKWIEDRIAFRATAICFTSPGAITDFLEKYPTIFEKNKLHLIENGFDEESFTEAESYAHLHPPSENRPITLVHSGVIYSAERDPRPFFKALKRLKDKGFIFYSNLHIILRATGNDNFLNRLIVEYGLEDIVEIAPALPYVQALSEMLIADGLILLQAANCNSQIPAKLYEYIRAGRPIIGLTDNNGDTASILKRFQINKICDIASIDDIESIFTIFLNQLTQEIKQIQSISNPQQYSREERTRTLAKLFDTIISQSKTGI
jgi:glycosyltransferase involved in cell wall biosynthesis